MLGEDGKDVAEGAPFDELVQGGVMDNGTYYVRRGDRWGLLEWRGPKLVAPAFKAISRQAGWPKVVTLEGGMSLLSSKGKLLLEQPVEWIDEAAGADRLYKSGAKIGVLHEDGRIVLPPDSDEVRVAAPGLFLVRTGSLWGLRDARGGKRIPVKYEALDGPYFGHFRGRIATQYTWFTIGDARLRSPAYATSNGAEPIDARLKNLAQDGIVSLLVDDQLAWNALSDEPAKGERLLTLALINREALEVEPEAADGVPLITVETQRPDGAWEPREDLRRVITCGNSYAVGAKIGSQLQRLMVVRWPAGTKGPVRYSVMVGKQKVDSRTLAK